MFLALLKYEYKYLLKKLSTYVYALVFLVFGFIMMNAIAGAFTDIRIDIMTGGAEQSFTNSSMNIMMITSGLNLLLILFMGGYLSDILLKDFSYDVFQMVYTKQVNKMTLLFTRLFVGITTIIGIFFCVQLGLILGRFSPWLDQAQFQPFNFLYYLNPFIKISITNIIIASSLYTLVAVLSKKKLYVNMSAILMYLVYSTVSAFTNRLDFKEIASLLDMFGLSTLGLMTESWTVAQRNTNLLHFNSYFLYNRLLWLGVALIVYISAFRLYQYVYPLAKTSKKKKLAEAESKEKPSYTHYGVISIKWNFKTYLKQFLHYFKIESKILFRSVIFKVFAGIYIVFVVSFLVNSSIIYDTAVHPVTYIVTENLLNIVLAFAVIFIAVFSSELVWKSRTSNCEMFEDSSPLPNSIKALSHLTTLVFSLAILWILGSVIGVGYQLFHGIYKIEFSLYLSYGGMLLLSALMYSAVAILIQNLAPNRMAGILIYFALFTAIGYLPYLGLEHTLWQAWSLPRVTYSDMNGFGSFLPRYFTYCAYWISFSLILFILGIRLYRTGSEQSLRVKAKNLLQNWTTPQVTATLLLLLIFLGSGSYIYYNTNILNTYRTKKESRLLSANYEKEYRYLNELLHPRVTDVDLDVQIYPEKLDLKVSGELTLRNKHTSALDTLLFYANKSKDKFTYSFDQDFTEIKRDDDFNLFIIKLDKSLQPNAELTFTFSDYYKHQGYEVDTNICENGTFVNSAMFMPVFGYSANYELQVNEIREKYDLPHRERMAERDDLKARANTYISQDSDWVNFAATVGTSTDQIAVAPGYLTKSWEEGSRKQFRYEMDHPILKFFSFSSARYEIAKDKWVSNSGKEVVLEIYHHPGHEYNLDSMMKALKMGLTYYSDNYMEYPHRQMRILEFPRYATFAQSFPNTVPYSEGIGFIAKVDSHDKQDYPFFVTAHELAHQWWAHVVIGADVQGAVLMSEALAQYSALSVMEQEYGEVKMGDFLKHELHSYVVGRSSESSKEMPLSKVENQQYIHYNKGSVVMYGLRQYVGETAINQALKEVVATYGYQEPPYLNSKEFLDIIYKQVPDSLMFLAKEMFEDIVLYSNAVKSVETTKEADRYRVDLSLECYKMRGDGVGNETEIPLDEWIEVLVFAEPEIDGTKQKIIANSDNRWFRLKSGHNLVTIYVDEKPTEAGVDPLFRLLDKNVFDNRRTIKTIKDNL